MLHGILLNFHKKVFLCRLPNILDDGLVIDQIVVISYSRWLTNVGNVGNITNSVKLSSLRQGRGGSFIQYSVKYLHILLGGVRCSHAVCVAGRDNSCCQARANRPLILSSADGDLSSDQGKRKSDKKNPAVIMKLLSRRVPVASFLRGVVGRRRDALIGTFNVGLIALVYRMLALADDLNTDLFVLYYQPWAPFLTMLWGWGLNVLYFERTGLRYDLCFEESDRHSLLSGNDILRLSNMLTFGFLFSAFSFLAFSMGSNLSAAAMQPIILYVSALLVLVMPFPILFRDTRKYFASTFWRVITPVRKVTWGDFLLADILTSLAKGFSDVERAVCSMVSGPILSGAQEQCTDASWTIPIFLALPYLWRLLQCIRVYIDTGNKQQLWNALKYTTAFPVVFFSFAKYHVGHQEWVSLWKPLWLFAAFINSSFSYFWDIERDWEISFFKNAAKKNPPKLPSPTQIPARAYHYLMISNLILRLSWAYKLSPHLRRNHIIVFVIVILEAFRRFQWIFARVEVEMRKVQLAHPDMGQLVPGLGRRRHVGLPSTRGNVSA